MSANPPHDHVSSPFLALDSVRWRTWEWIGRNYELSFTLYLLEYTDLSAKVIYYTKRDYKPCQLVIFDHYSEVKVSRVLIHPWLLVLLYISKNFQVFVSQKISFMDNTQKFKKTKNVVSFNYFFLFLYISLWILRNEIFISNALWRHNASLIKAFCSFYSNCLYTL